MVQGPVQHHGMSKARGCEHVAVARFTKLFPGLNGLALSEDEAALIGGPGGVMHDFDGTSPDSPVPAGYIFFAQFIDHDITLDAGSKLRDEPKTDSAIKELPNIRSVSLDLDCVYGFGPEASPHIYDPDRPGRLAVHPNGVDLARSPGGVALIGDPRNDENLFVSQLQLLFHRFHNAIYELRHPDFERAQAETRHHYQWLVLFDFLKRICDREVFKFVVPKILRNDASTYPLIYQPEQDGTLAMPVEFSVAAYRVGHTMVRSVYAVNEENPDVELFDERFGTLGFSELPAHLAVDWRYLLPVEDCITPRFAKAIDPLLADEIQAMPRPVVPSNNPNDRALGFRNLMRGNALSLPSGQDVARALADKGYPVDPAFNLNLTELPGWSRAEDAASNRQPPLRDATPLFLYVLRESQLANGGERLGPTGSAILLEVFGGMLVHCQSFLDADDWNPDPCVSKERWSIWHDEYREGFSRDALIQKDDYYPFELADIVRFLDEAT